MSAADMNRFGATEVDLLAQFTLAGYTATAADLGGSAYIGDELSAAAYQIIQAIPGDTLRRLQEPELCRIVSRATAGQTTATLPLTPAVSGSVHIWRGQPSLFVVRPVLATDDLGMVIQSDGGQVEIAESQFSVAGATVTLTTALSRNDQVYATYDVDVGNAAFSVPSLASLVVDGTVAAIGAKLYTQANAEWAFVARKAESFAAAVEALADGTAIPPEVRVLQWWKEPEPATAGSWQSIRKFRA